MPLSWSSRKQFLYFLIFAGIVLIFAIIFLLPILSPSPTCADGKKNGDEVGIDCGGGCAKLCSSQYQPISVLWSRAFNVSPSVYHLVAYVENKNIASGVQSMPYKFTLRDENNILITEKIGYTFIGPNNSIVIFEPSVYVGQGNRVPVYTSFVFLNSAPNWVAMDSASIQKLSVFAKNPKMTASDTLSKLTATLENKSFYDISNFEVMAVVYDKKGNAVDVSKTLVDLLPAQSEKIVSYTWSKSITNYGKIDIIPRVNPFSKY